MGFVHGKDTVLTLDGDDISAFCNTSELNIDHDEHDVTCYGSDDHVVKGGLGSGSVSLGGIYDDTASGPKAVIEPLLNTVVTLIRRPEGIGTGLPQESLPVLVKRYRETNPADNMITWSLECTKAGAVTRTTQS